MGRLGAYFAPARPPVLHDEHARPLRPRVGHLPEPNLVARPRPRPPRLRSLGLRLGPARRGRLARGVRDAVRPRGSARRQCERVGRVQRSVRRRGRRASRRREGQVRRHPAQVRRVLQGWEGGGGCSVSRRAGEAGASGELFVQSRRISLVLLSSSLTSLSSRLWRREAETSEAGSLSGSGAQSLRLGELDEKRLRGPCALSALSRYRLCAARVSR